MTLAKSIGKSLKFVNGLDIKPAGPAKLKQIAERVKARPTDQIALLLPIANLAAARRLATEHGHRLSNTAERDYSRRADLSILGIYQA